jgi:hypothetical protein
MLPLTALAVLAAISLGHAQTSKREDCTPYDPSSIRLTHERDHWLISRADGARFMVFDTQEDAETLLTVFKAHSALCYVGRDNKRPNRKAYVNSYWK